MQSCERYFFSTVPGKTTAGLETTACICPSETSIKTEATTSSGDTFRLPPGFIDIFGRKKRQLHGRYSKKIIVLLLSLFSQ